ncbi:MAG: glycosyltransferase [Nanoarchaeota archaeon]|nr:glycosyltransferase [Nanoarchaeota archaeon]
MILIDKLIIYSVTYFGLFTAVFFLITFFENRKKVSNPKLTSFPKLSVGVPMFNVSDHVRKTVESLLKLDYPKDKLEILIIDDGSTDDSYDIAKEYTKYPQVRLFRQKNSGKCKAINLALKKATGELFAVLDVDAFVTSDCLKKMVGYFNNPKVMAVTPSLKVYSPKNLLQKIQMMEFLLGVYLRKVFAQLGSIHVTPGCFTVYRKDFFDRTGPYQEGNLTEDIEVAFRIQSHDYIIENSIDANVYTLGVPRFSPLLNQRLRWYKGFMDNTLAYKRVFSPSYGNLGMFILPSAFISVGIAILMSLYSLTKFVQQNYTAIMTFINTNFDISQFFRWHFDPFFINLNGVFVLAISSLFISIAAITIAKRWSNEKQPIAASFILFALTYLFLFAFWWLGAGYCKIAKKKIRWGNQYL